MITAILLFGCNGASAPDADGDGISDEDEIASGLQPNLADSDSDGWDDGVEVDSYTDARDRYDHPYTGGWPIDSCRNDIEPSGTGIGSVAPNLTMTDQNGDSVKLHDFCDHTVLTVVGAMWCYSCQLEAQNIPAIQAKYGDEGLVILNIEVYDEDGGIAEPDDLTQWAEQFGISTAVLSDYGYDQITRLGGSVGFGSTLIGPGAKVLSSVDGEFTDADIEAALP